MNEPRIYTFIVDEEESGERLDSWLAAHVPELSRSRIQKALKGGEVLVGGRLNRWRCSPRIFRSKSSMRTRVCSW
jgi:23S rRNA-/tRNA-specific pseudouridylate synthase